MEIDAVSPSLNVQRAVVLLTFLGVVVLVLFPVHNFDIFWHIANGREMLQRGAIVQEEVFSYTAPGRAFHNHEWLSQIGFYLIFDAFGAGGLIVFKLIIALAVAAVLYRTSRLVGAGPLMACMVLALALLSSYKRYTVRPQLFSFLFLALLCHVLYGVRAGRLRWQALFAVPPVIVLWDFLHGAVYGVLFLGAFMAGETLKRLKRGRVKERQVEPLFMKRLLAVFAVTGLAMLLNPFGPRSYDVFFKFADASYNASSFMEFAKTPLVEFGLFWFLLIFTATLMAVFIRRLDTTHLLVVASFAALAIKYNRATAAFAIVAVPALSYYMRLMAEELKSPSEGRWLRRYFYAMLVFAASVVIALKFFTPYYPYSTGFGLYQKHYPAGAAEFIEKSGLRGNMYNPGHIGGYLAYRLYPERRIFLYNHHTVFADVMRDTLSEDFIGRYNINYAVIPHFPEWWKEDFFTPDRWATLYDDGSAAVLIRNTPENRPLIERAP